MTDEAAPAATGCESLDAVDPDVELHDEWRLNAPVDPARDDPPDEQDDAADTRLQADASFRACRQSFIELFPDSSKLISAKFSSMVCSPACVGLASPRWNVGPRTVLLSRLQKGSWRRRARGPQSISM
jgi:hypothetical protein